MIFDDSGGAPESPNHYLEGIQLQNLLSCSCCESCNFGWRDGSVASVWTRRERAVHCFFHDDADLPFQLCCGELLSRDLKGLRFGIVRDVMSSDLDH